MNEFWAFAAAPLFILLSLDPLAEGTAANTEMFMLLPLILSQIVFLKAAEQSRNVLSMLLCGALTAVAISFKQVAGVNWFLLMALYPIFGHVEKKRLRGAKDFAAWTAVG